MKIRNEPLFSALICDIINAEGGHAVKIESHATACGQPDLNVCYRKKEFNIELKCFGEDGYVPEIRASQARWFDKRIKAGGRPVLMCFMKDGERGWVYVISDVQQEGMRGKMKRNEMSRMCSHRWEVNEYLPGKLMLFLEDN